MENPTSKKKLSKSTKYYLICGGAAVLLIIILGLLYAAVTQTNVFAWLGSKYGLLILGALLIYAVVGVILFVKDKIKRM